MGSGQRLSGINPLAYVGVEPTSPPQVVIQGRQPTTNDYTDYNLGTFWLMVVEQEVWILVSKLNGTASWIQLFPGAGGGASQFPTDAGTANEVGNELDIFGGTNINTAGAGKTVTVNLDDTIFLAGSVVAGTGLTVTTGGILATGTIRFTSLNAFGVVQTALDGTLSTTAGTDGQVLIGATALPPQWGNITSTGGTILVTEGANTINLENSGSFGATFSAVGNLAETYLNVDASNDLFIGQQSAMIELVDVGNNFFPGDGAGNGATFTAPSTGNYSFSFYTHINVRLPFTVGAPLLIEIRTSIATRIYQAKIFGNGPTLVDYGATFPMTIIIPLLVNEVVSFLAKPLAPIGEVNILGSSPTGPNPTWISGHRV